MKRLYVIPIVILKIIIFVTAAVTAFFKITTDLLQEVKWALQSLRIGEKPDFEVPKNIYWFLLFDAVLTIVFLLYRHLYM